MALPPTVKSAFAFTTDLELPARTVHHAPLKILLESSWSLDFPPAPARGCDSSTASGAIELEGEERHGDLL
jgi:hypothetical protein